MEIIKNRDGENLKIALKGRLDTNTSVDLEKETENLDGVKRLELDFKNLEYISSAGLRVLLSAQKSISPHGNMVIKNANEDITEVFEITGFIDIFDVE